MVVSADKRLIEPLNESLGLEDLEDLIEIILTDAHNQRVMNKQREKENK